MFRGDRINTTEHRAVLHVALRAPAGEKIGVDGRDVVPDVRAVLDRMAAFAEQVRSGAWLGHSGKRIRNVISRGIGGTGRGESVSRCSWLYIGARSSVDEYGAFNYI